MDAIGQTWDDSLGLSTSLLTSGCILSATGNPDGVVIDDTAVNDHPVYEAARDLANRHVRFIKRSQFHSYEVVSGASILKLRRYLTIPGASEPFDALAGLAPDGSDTDGIRHTAPVAGWTNEWVMFLQLHAYKDLGTESESESLWKATVYGDYYAWCQRCLFQAQMVAAGDLEPFVNYNKAAPTLGSQTSFISPEAPDAYSYADGANIHAGHNPPVQFYKSCRLYEPPAELDTVTLEGSGTDQLVVLTFRLPTGSIGTWSHRLRSHESAPASWVVGDGPGSALGAGAGLDETSVGLEDYRTDDNALREYSLLLATGRNAAIRTGDYGLSIYGTRPSTFDANDCWGTVLPHFVFVKLVPKPHEDTGDLASVQDPADTRVTIDAFHQCELYLRAMVEGFIDPAATAALNLCHVEGGACASEGHGLYDFTWSSACYSAGNDLAAAAAADETLPADHAFRYIGAFSLTTRTDDPPGHGPLPGVQAAVSFAQIYNRCAALVNQLTRARVILPFSFVTKTTNYAGSANVVDSESWTPACGRPSGGDSACSGNYAVAININHPGIAQVAATDYAEAGEAVAFDGWGIEGTVPGCSEAGTFHLDRGTQVCDYRFILIDPNALQAIPDAWRYLLHYDSTHTVQLGTLFCRAFTLDWVTGAGVAAPDITGILPPGAAATVTTNGPCLDVGMTIPCELTESHATWTDCVLASVGHLEITAPAEGLSYAGRQTGGPCALGPGAHVSLIPILGTVGGATFVEVPIS